MIKKFHIKKKSNTLKCQRRAPEFNRFMTQMPKLNRQSNANLDSSAEKQKIQIDQQIQKDLIEILLKQHQQQRELLQLIKAQQEEQAKLKRLIKYQEELVLSQYRQNKQERQRCLQQIKSKQAIQIFLL